MAAFCSVDGSIAGRASSAVMAGGIGAGARCARRRCRPAAQAIAVNHKDRDSDSLIKNVVKFYRSGLKTPDLGDPGRSLYRHRGTMILRLRPGVADNISSWLAA
jgi:hypothetical protein